MILPHQLKRGFARKLVVETEGKLVASFQDFGSFVRWCNRHENLLLRIAGEDPESVCLLYLSFKKGEGSIYTNKDIKKYLQDYEPIAPHEVSDPHIDGQNLRFVLGRYLDDETLVLFNLTLNLESGAYDEAEIRQLKQISTPPL